MERKELIKQTLDLFYNHKQATALDMEYTSEIYDLLVEQGYINLTKQQKLDIFAKAKRLYATDLNIVMTAGTLDEIKEAMNNLKRLKTNELDSEQREYLALLCKRLSMKECFDMNQVIKLI
jgi:rRNA-processing protein FCF1